MYSGDYRSAWAARRRLLTGHERLRPETFAKMWNSLIDTEVVSREPLSCGFVPLVILSNPTLTSRHDGTDNPNCDTWRPDAEMTLTAIPKGCRERGSKLAIGNHCYISSFLPIQWVIRVRPEPAAPMTNVVAAPTMTIIGP